MHCAECGKAVDAYPSILPREWRYLPLGVSIAALVLLIAFSFRARIVTPGIPAAGEMFSQMVVDNLSLGEWREIANGTRVPPFRPSRFEDRGNWAGPAGWAHDSDAVVELYALGDLARTHRRTLRLGWPMGFFESSWTDTVVGNQIRPYAYYPGLADTWWQFTPKTTLRVSTRSGHLEQRLNQWTLLYILPLVALVWIAADALRRQQSKLWHPTTCAALVGLFLCFFPRYEVQWFAMTQLPVRPGWPIGLTMSQIRALSDDASGAQEIAKKIVDAIDLPPVAPGEPRRAAVVPHIPHDSFFEGIRGVNPRSPLAIPPDTLIPTYRIRPASPRPESHVGYGFDDVPTFAVRTLRIDERESGPAFGIRYENLWLDLTIRGDNERATYSILVPRFLLTLGIAMILPTLAWWTLATSAARRYRTRRAANLCGNCGYPVGTSPPPT
ncbi:MAG TPA: hypothetical protein VF777_07550 [Phycisphaerales bacterium]